MYGEQNSCWKFCHKCSGCWATAVVRAQPVLWGGRSQFCSELEPLVERPSDFLIPSIPDRKYMFRIGTCMKTNFDIDRRFRSAEVSELQLFYGRSQFCRGRSQFCWNSLTWICFRWHCPISLMWCSASDFNSVPFLWRIVDISVNVKWPSVIFQPAPDVLCPISAQCSNNNVFQTAKNVMINPRENELKVQIEDQEKTTLCRRVTSYFSRLRQKRPWRGAAGQLSGRPMRPWGSPIQTYQSSSEISRLLDGLWTVCLKVMLSRLTL